MSHLNDHFMYKFCIVNHVKDAQEYKVPILLFTHLLHERLHTLNDHFSILKNTNILNKIDSHLQL